MFHNAHMRSRAASWLLVAALLWAQNLGLWHRLVHPAASAPVHAVAALAQSVADGADAAFPLGAWLERLFSSHQDGTDCLGFDHATLGAALLAATLVLHTLAGSTHVCARRRTGVQRGAWTHFQARAPPDLR